MSMLSYHHPLEDTCDVKNLVKQTSDITVHFTPYCKALIQLYIIFSLHNFQIKFIHSHFKFVVYLASK